MAGHSKQRGSLYLDALGTPGRRDGPSLYAQCLVWTPLSAGEMEEMFADVRKDLGLRREYEFHARQVTKEQWKQRMPQRFFELLRQRGLAIEVWCVGVDKQRSKLPLEIDGKQLVNELVSRTCMEMPRERIDGIPLSIDERVHDKKAPQIVREMRRYINGGLSERGYTIGPVRARESHQCAGIQLADFLVTAVMKPWPDCQEAIGGWEIHMKRW